MVHCNECNKEFNTEVKIEKYERGIEKIYFNCPYCNQEYIAYFTDENIRRQQAQIRLLQSKISKKKLKQLQNKLQKDMHELSIKMLGTQ